MSIPEAIAPESGDSKVEAFIQEVRRLGAVARFLLIALLVCASWLLFNLGRVLLNLQSPKAVLFAILFVEPFGLTVFLGALFVASPDSTIGKPLKFVAARANFIFRFIGLLIVVLGFWTLFVNAQRFFPRIFGNR